MGVGIASAGISLGLFIGVAASFVYVILAGIKWASEQLDPPTEGLDIDHCTRCGCDFSDVEDGTCSMCDLTICAHCSIQYKQNWLCATCIKRRDAELIGTDWKLSNFRERIDRTLPSARNGKRECDVRDFVEKLTENILGSRLDDVRIDYVTEDPYYMLFMDKYEDVLSLTISRFITSIQLIIDGVDIGNKNSPKKIHDQLKSLINDIIVEANSLKLHSTWNGKGRKLGTKTYENILATAILNKIIHIVNTGRFQLNIPNSSYDQSIYDEDEQEEKFLLPSPTSYGNMNIRNSKGIASWPELDIDVLDELLYPDVKTKNDELWKDNWVLERKSNESSVAMLIPSPNGKVKPLIGDREVDQLSDSSDNEDENFIFNENWKNSTNGNINAKLIPELSKEFKVSNENYMLNSVPKQESNLENDFDLIEARNYVFSSNDLNSEDETIKKEKDREFPEVIHPGPTKITISHMEPKKDHSLDRKNRKSVKELAEQFSEKSASGFNHSVHSLTGRNLTRDRSTSPLDSYIDYWEEMIKVKK